MYYYYQKSGIAADVTLNGRMCVVSAPLFYEKVFSLSYSNDIVLIRKSKILIFTNLIKTIILIYKCLLKIKK